MVPSPVCLTCQETKSAILCYECHAQQFCSFHVSHGQNDLAKRMDIIKQEHELLQRDIHQQYVKHPLLSRINIWEQQSIKNIHNAANTARAELENIYNRYKNKTKLLKDEFKQYNYTEVHLNKWREQLEELRRMLQLSLNINYVCKEHDDSSVIPLIQLNSYEGK